MGSQVVVAATLAADHGDLVIEVSDSGPGIPAELRSEVFERFRHGAVTGPLPRIRPAGDAAVTGDSAVSGRSTLSGGSGVSLDSVDSGVAGRPPETPSGGTGLGLAIARWAAALHGGSVEVVDSVQGCVMRVVLPPG